MLLCCFFIITTDGYCFIVLMIVCPSRFSKINEREKVNESYDCAFSLLQAPFTPSFSIFFYKKAPKRLTIKQPKHENENLSLIFCAEKVEKGDGIIRFPKTSGMALHMWRVLVRENRNWSLALVQTQLSNKTPYNIPSVLHGAN